LLDLWDTFCSLQPTISRQIISVSYLQTFHGLLPHEHESL
jgi:hypothetical protein